MNLAYVEITDEMVFAALGAQHIAVRTKSEFDSMKSALAAAMLCAGLVVKETA